MKLYDEDLRNQKKRIPPTYGFRISFKNNPFRVTIWNILFIF